MNDKLIITNLNTKLDNSSQLLNTHATTKADNSIFIDKLTNDIKTYHLIVEYHDSLLIFKENLKAINTNSMKHKEFELLIDTLNNQINKIKDNNIDVYNYLFSINETLHHNLAQLIDILKINSNFIEKLIQNSLSDLIIEVNTTINILESTLMFKSKNSNLINL